VFYKVFLKKKKLKKHSVFFCGGSNYLSKIFYADSSWCCLTASFTELLCLRQSLHRLLPFLIALLQKNDSILFIGAQFAYARGLDKVRFLAHILGSRKPGIFSNFCLTKMFTVENVSLRFMPKIAFFFSLNEISLVMLREAKTKNIPAIALVGASDSTCLIDYPVLLDSKYFYNTFFFISFLFSVMQG
jgi:hypothetical protein